jgi:hypothetical protein
MFRSLQVRGATEEEICSVRTLSVQDTNEWFLYDAKDSISIIHKLWEVIWKELGFKGS